MFALSCKISSKSAKIYCQNITVVYFCKTCIVLFTKIPHLLILSLKKKTLSYSPMKRFRSLPTLKLDDVWGCRDEATIISYTCIGNHSEYLRWSCKQRTALHKSDEQHSWQSGVFCRVTIALPTMPVLIRALFEQSWGKITNNYILELFLVYICKKIA